MSAACALRPRTAGGTLIVLSDFTGLLAKIESGDRQAADRLLPLVYDKLRKLAAAKLAHEQPGHTLQARALQEA